MSGPNLSACRWIRMIWARQIEEAILDEVKGGKVARMDDDGIEQAMKRTTQRTCYHQVGKKPMIRVMINRLD